MDGDGVDTSLPWTRIGFKGCLLDSSFLCTQYNEVIIQVFLVFKCSDVDYGFYRITRLNVDQVLDGSAFGGFVSFRNLISLFPLYFAAFCKNEQEVMGVSDKEMLGEVIFFSSYTAGTNTTPALGSVLGKRSALDVSLIGNGDHHFLIRDHIFR